MEYQQHQEANMESPPFQFTNKSVRQGFQKKVYGILCVQLAITAVIIFTFISVPGLRLFVLRWYEVFSFVSTFGVLGFVLVLSLVEEARRSWPTNIICLLSFTVFEAISLASISCWYQTGGVLTAVCLTAAVTSVLTLFAWQTKIDFTILGAALLLNFVFFICMGFSFVYLFSNFQNILTAISLYGVVLFGIYVVYDTQRMMDGRHAFCISPEEYIYASLTLYLDIVNLFLEFLNLTGRPRRNDE